MKTLKPLFTKTLLSAGLFLMLGGLMAVTIIILGEGGEKAAAIDTFEISARSYQNWMRINESFAVPGRSITEPDAGNPLLVPGATGLDLLVHGTDAVHPDYRKHFNTLNIRPLKHHLFMGMHRVWNSIDYRVQGIEYFKIAHTPEGFFSIFTDVPEAVVHEAVKTYEPYLQFDPEGYDDYGTVRYQKSQAHRYTLIYFFDSALK